MFTVIAPCPCGGNFIVPTVSFGPEPPMPICDECECTSERLDEVLTMESQPYGMPMLTWIGYPYKVKSGDGSNLH